MESFKKISFYITFYRKRGSLLDTSDRRMKTGHYAHPTYPHVF